MTPYDYKTTSPRDGEIRLLKLRAGTTDLEANLILRSIDPLRTSDFTEPPEIPELDIDRPFAPPAESFKALSYTWGPDAVGKKPYIKILASDESYTINMKPNLEAALRQLRSPTEPNLFWIDALCINQSDNEEKSLQIPRMSDIYTKAEQVCIWLGPEEGNSALTMDFIQTCLKLDDFDQLVRDASFSKERAVLSALMSRPWFSRRWIVQELARARKGTLYCGKASIPWQNFADVVSLISSKQSEIRQLFRESSAFRHHPDYIGDLRELAAVQLIYISDNLFRKSDDGEIIEHLVSLEAIMSSLPVFEASDSCDILYAILWLANDASPVTKKVRKWDRHIASLRGLSTWTFDDYALFSSPLASPLLSQATFDYMPLDPLYSEESPATSQDPRKLAFTTNSRTHVTVPRRKASLNTATTTDQPPSYEPDDPNGTQRHLGSQPGKMNEANNTDAEGSGNTSQEHFSAHNNPADDDGLPPKIILELPQKRSSSTEEKERAFKASMMLKLLTAVRSRQIVVDYDKKVFDICKEFLTFTIRRSKGLDMICYPWAPNELPQESPLPSWVTKLTGKPFGIWR